METKSKVNSKFLNVFTVTDLLNIPIHIVDDKGNVLFVNKCWSKKYHITKEACIGRYITSLTKEFMPDRTFTFEIISKPNEDVSLDLNPEIKPYNTVNLESPAAIALKEKRVVTLLCHENDDTYTVCQSSPVFDDDGTVLYVVTFVQNTLVYSTWQSQLNTISNQYLPNVSESLKNYTFNHLQGESNIMLWVKHLITLVANSEATVLITGESGSGKELVAKEIVEHSPRKDKPFITVNCSAIPKDLIESELFGYDKGAFTGADRTKPGLFEEADGGTIFLDEIGEMPLYLQSKLLRVLQEKTVTHVGGLKPNIVDVRVIAATNADLKEKIKDGSFRLDLFYRLNVFPIEMPPLRFRRNDIPILVNHFLNQINKRNRTSKEVSEEGLQIMKQYNWPGNVRELQNFVERTYLYSENNAVISGPLISEQIHRQFNLVLIDQVEPEFTAVQSQEDSSSVASIPSITELIEKETALKEIMGQYEKEVILQAMQKHGSTHKAAKALKTSQPTIVRKMHSYDINISEDDE